MLVYVDRMTSETAASPASEPSALVRWWLPAVLALAVLVHLLLPSAGPLDGYDEKIYGTYILTLCGHGVSGLRTVAEAWPGDERLNKGPLPFRVAFLATGAAVHRVLGGDPLANLALVSHGFGILTVLAAGWLFRRWFPPLPAAVATLLVLASPLLLGLSRRALQDTCLAFFAVLALALLDRAWREQRRADLVGLTVVLTLGWMTKESMLFLHAVFAVLAVYYGVTVGWRGRWPLLAVFGVPPLLYFGMCVALAGGLHPVIETFTVYGRQQLAIPYARAFQQGPWYRYLADLVLVSPLTFLLALAGLAETGRAPAGYRLGAAALGTLAGLAVFTCLPLLNVRLLAFVEVPLRALAAAGLGALAQRLPTPRWGRPALWLVAGATVAIAVDASQFVRLFETGRLYDPVTAELIRAGGFVR